MNTARKLGKAVALSALVSSWAGSALAQPRMPTHVACVGDSITAGTGASSTATNYPSDLQGLFGSSVQVKNFGHSGATLLTTGNTPYVKQTEYTSATTFVSGAGASAIVDVIIMLGTNDSKPANWSAGAHSQEFGTDAASLIDHFANLATHPAVYLALPLYAGSNSYTISETVIKNEIIPVLQQVAMQKGLATIDLQTPTTGHPEDLTDGVHPNDAGYQLVSKTMHDGLLRVPQVSITMPTTGASIAGSLVNIVASASGGNVAIASVEFFNGSTSLAKSTMAPFSAALNNQVPGSYSLTAKATDTTGAAATSTPVLITVGGGGAAGAAGDSGSAGFGGAAASTAGASSFGGSSSDSGGVAGSSGSNAPGAGGADEVSGSANGVSGSTGTDTAGAAQVVPSGASAAPDSSSGCSCSSSRGTGAPWGVAALSLLMTACLVRRNRHRVRGGS